MELLFSWTSLKAYAHRSVQQVNTLGTDRRPRLLTYNLVDNRSIAAVLGEPAATDPRTEQI